MKKNLLILPLTAALLAACGSATPPAPITLNTLTLGGVNGPLKIEAPAKLTVTATGTDGNPFTGTATFTSSEPNVVSVAADGTLTVRHLSTRPVTLTVNEADKTASVTVTTYGLDFAPGTYQVPGFVGTTFVVRYVDASGNALTTDGALSIRGPAGFNKDVTLTTPYPTALGTRAGFYDAAVNVLAVDGPYTATLTIGSMTFSKTATLDTKSLLGTPKDVGATLTTTNATVTGTLPAGAARFNINVFKSPDNTFVTSSAPASSLPATLAWLKPFAPGVYRSAAVVRTYFGSTIDGVTANPIPDQVNGSSAYTADMTIN